MDETIFDDIRPYYDSEINAAMMRIIKDPLFDKVASYLYPNKNTHDLKNMFSHIHTAHDFQRKVMHYAMNQIVKKTMTNFTINGLQYLNKQKSYLFISNHRDIIIDSGLLQVALIDHGFKTTEMTFGSNLMHPSFVVDIGKSNKMFKVERAGSPRDFYNNSIHLSKYIRHTITTKNKSVWIAQRNGRTKDGNDTTDQGILKMFCMSGNGNIIENLSELNMVPMSVSYQWETCDSLKVKELYQSKQQKYIKQPGEDLQSILTGVTQFKGHFHIEIAPPITTEELHQYAAYEKNECFHLISKLIDKKIHSYYQLHDTNYIAYDIENNSNCYLNTKYTADSRTNFELEMNKKLDTLEGDRAFLKSIFLGIYSNPVKNKLK